MWTKLFWKETAERATKSTAQSLVILIGTDVVNVVNLDWGFIVGASVTYGLVSILTSIGSYGGGTPGTPSLVNEAPRH